MTWSREQLLQWMRRLEARASNASAYDLLEVHPGATSTELHAAFYRMADHAHPDLHRDLSETDRARLIKCFGRVSAAYATLRSPDQRQRHDTANPPRRTMPPPSRAPGGASGSGSGTGTGTGTGSGSGIITIPPPTRSSGVFTIPSLESTSDAPAAAPSVARAPGRGGATIPPNLTRPPVANPANTAAARAMIYFRKGEAALRQGDLGAALFNLRLAQAADPSSSEIAELLASVTAGTSGGGGGDSGGSGGPRQ